MRIHLSFALAAAALCAGATASLALTATGSFNSQLIITDECNVVATTILDFGSNGFIIAVIDTTSAISVQCTNGTPYTISLNGGNGLSGTTTTRTMENGAQDIDYTMSKNVARTQNWGDTGLEIMTSLAGNGAVQVYTVYGRVPVQATPSVNTYTDLVTVTVTYP